MRISGTVDNWHGLGDGGDARPSGSAQKVAELLAYAGITVNGGQPWDLRVHDQRFFQRVLATGNLGEATALIGAMQEDIEELVASIPPSEEMSTYYHELDGSYFTVTSETFIGEIYALGGLENIADEAEDAETLYPQLSAEYIIDADPDLIFLADTKCCGESPETVAARPGWAALRAVSSGSVIALDDDIASRWGPRVVELLRAIAEAVITLGRSLNLKVIAEGVETREQAAFLWANGCDQIQGHFFSRALSAEGFTTLLESGRTLDIDSLPDKGRQAA